MNGVLYSGVLHALLLCAYLQNCRAQVINLEFGFVFPSLNVTEGESVRVCLSIQSLQLQPQLLAGTLANLTVEFITAGKLKLYVVTIHLYTNAGMCLWSDTYVTALSLLKVVTLFLLQCR